VGADRELRAQELLTDHLQQLRGLRQENRELRAALAEAQARLDAQGDYQVFIVPGIQYLNAAMAAMEGDTLLRDGDRLRVAGTAREWTYRSGTWESGTVLSTPGTGKQGPREKIMAEEDKTPSSYQLRPIDTGGATWEARVNEGGYFTAEHSVHGTVNGWSYGEIEDKARKATTIGRIKVNVPYARMKQTRNGWRVVLGTGTGIHGGTGNVLLREGGESSQGTYGTRSYFRPPTPQQEAELIRLLTEKDAIGAAFKELADQLAFPGGGLDRAVKDEVDRAKRGVGNEDA
jgi:hypothetical protein